MILFLVFSLLFAPSFEQIAPIIVEFDHVYENQTTHGKHIQSLYEISAINDTRPFAIRIVLASRDATQENKIDLKINRGPSELQAMLPRTQTYDLVSKDYWFLAETLCEKRYLSGNSYTEFNETVSISVSSRAPAFFDFEVKRVHGFVIDFRPKQVALSPSEPLFFRFSFSEGVDQIAIRITSFDDICGRVTVLKADCPVFDSAGQVVLYNNYRHQTITRKGFLIIQKDDFDSDIHIVIAALPIDEPCLSMDRSSILRDNPFRIKNLTVEVQPYNPSRWSLGITGGVFLIVLTAACVIAYYFLRDNNRVDEDRAEDGTLTLWLFPLLQIFAVVPLALVVVSIHETDSLSSSDTDTCNFNFECAIPFIGLVAVNNMISAFSIVVIAGINIFYSIFIDRWRRMFPLNAWILVTGIFWTGMNKCPQGHTFHLYSIAMLLTVVEAKLLLFGKRNGRYVWNYVCVGAMTMTMLVFNILDTYLESKKIRGILLIATLVIDFTYVVTHFSYSHGIREETNLNKEACQPNGYHKIEAEPGFINQQTEEQTPDEAQIPILSGTSTNTGTINETRNQDPIIGEADGNQANTNDQEPLLQGQERSQNGQGETEAEKRNSMIKKTKMWKRLFFVFALVNLLVWNALSFVWFDSTIAMLRFIQTDFVLYFIFYLCNKLSTENLRYPKEFISSTVLCTLCIILWGVISAFLLPAYVPWSPAESRTLNSSCFSILGVCLGIDWHDILHFTTALICFFYPLMIVVMDDDTRINVPETNF